MRLSITYRDTRNRTHTVWWEDADSIAASCGRWRSTPARGLLLAAGCGGRDGVAIRQLQL